MIVRNKRTVSRIRRWFSVRSFMGFFKLLGVFPVIEILLGSPLCKNDICVAFDRAQQPESLKTWHGVDFVLSLPETVLENRSAFFSDWNVVHDNETILYDVSLTEQHFISPSGSENIFFVTFIIGECGCIPVHKIKCNIRVFFRNTLE